MQIILPIVGLFLLGFLARSIVTEPANLVKWLNNFIVYLAMPSLILLKVPQLGLSADMVIPVSVAWAWLFVGSALVIILSRLFAWLRSIEGAMLLLVVLGNTSFLGYPMVLAFFNDKVLAYAIFYDQLGGFLILSTFGMIVIAAYSPSIDSSVDEASGIGRIKLLKIVRKVFTFPPFIALILAAFVPLDDLIVRANSALVTTSTLLMPAALFVLGIQFQPKLLPQHRVPLIAAISLKMVVAPVLALLVFAGMGIGGDVRTATVFEAAMPSMITPGLMAIHAGIAPRFIATLLGYSTVFAFVSLPLLAWFLSF